MDGVNELNALLAVDPDPELISLEYLNMVSLEPMLPQLASLKRLRKLNLHGNHLLQLPPDLSGLRALHSLNLENNTFEHVADIIPPLRSLPALSELRISLTEVEEEELLMALPSLTKLNGTDLTLPAAAPDSSGAALASQPVQAVPGAACSPPEVKMAQEDLEGVALLFGAIKVRRAKPCSSP